MAKEKSKKSILFAGKDYLRLIVNIETAITEASVSGHYNSELRLLERLFIQLKRFMTTEEKENIQHNIKIAKSMLRNVGMYKSKGMNVALPLGHAQDRLTQVSSLIHEYAGDVFLKTSADEGDDIDFGQISRDSV